MPEDTSNPPRKSEDNPHSLHGMTPEVSIQRAFGTPSTKKPPFAIGDRVEVTENFPHHDLRTATGVVIPTPEPCDDGQDLVWVKFDAPMHNVFGTSKAAAGIGPNYLRPI